MSDVTTNTLLAAFFELKALSPNSKSWTEIDFANNSPRLHRLLALKAIFRAYKLVWDPVNFENGTTLCSGRHTHFQTFFKDNGKRVRIENLTETGTRSWRHAFKFAQELDRIYTHNDGLLMSDPVLRHVMKIVDETQKLIQPKRLETFAFLGKIISPERASFSVQDLIASHGYPTTNLAAIDADNF